MTTTTTNFNSSYFICLVAGSRSFNDYELLSQTLDNLLSNQPKVAIVSGGARGADSLAERYAKEHNLPLKVFPADWNRFGKSAGYKRNRQMHEFIAQFKNRGCVCFWDGQSRGTAHNFELCKEFNNPLRIKRFKAESKGSASALKKDKELHYDAYVYENRFTIEGMKQICCSQCPFNGQCDDRKVVKCAAWKCLPHTPGALDKSIVDLYWSVAMHMDAELGYLDPQSPPVIPQSLKASK